MKTHPISFELTQISDLIINNQSESRRIFIQPDKAEILIKRLRLLIQMVKNLENELDVYRIQKDTQEIKAKLNDLADDFIIHTSDNVIRADFGGQDDKR